MKKLFNLVLLLIGFASVSFGNEKIEIISWAPRIFYIHHFLSDIECNYLIGRSTPFLTESVVIDPSAESGKPDPRRSSKGFFFTKEYADPFIQNIENRIAYITHFPVEHGEALHVVRYGKGGEYQPHFDYFDPETYGGWTALKNGGQRLASLIIYLNTPQEGGETIFPHASVSITPKKGDALFFFNCLPGGDVDPLSFHGGSPVIEGEKWIATKWLREYPTKW